LSPKWPGRSLPKAPIYGLYPSSGQLEYPLYAFVVPPLWAFVQ